jgi:glycosyltransferase involved in cell wall biosynthesis
MTYGRIITRRNIKWINHLPNKNILFTAPSDWCVSTGNVSGKWYTVYNAIDFSKYTLVENLPPDAPLIFLSRLERLKGAHEAIQIALETGNRLILAGNISGLPEEKEYFMKEIEPYIDGERIIYVGTLDDEGKNKYLGMSKAMLFPARTEEAFGMVMVEAMACGTPVLAYGSAAIPEVVTEGITGYILDNIEDMKRRIDELSKFNRKEVRIFSQMKFDVKVVASRYLEVSR